MSRDLGRDVPDLEKLYARKLRADFSYPTLSSFLANFPIFRLFFRFSRGGGPREAETYCVAGQRDRKPC